MKKRTFFICGSMNQTTQMHAISEHLPECEHAFSPYDCDGPLELLRRLGLIQFTIAGTSGRDAAGTIRGIKLHPNENTERPTREIHRHAPEATVLTTGSAEEMIANCDVLITRFSSTVFVGLALAKDTYSDFDMDDLRRRMPIRNGSAALNIANVCRRLLGAAPAR